MKSLSLLLIPIDWKKNFQQHDLIYHYSSNVLLEKLPQQKIIEHVVQTEWFVSHAIFMEASLLLNYVTEVNSHHVLN